MKRSITPLQRMLEVNCFKLLPSFETGQVITKARELRAANKDLSRIDSFASAAKELVNEHNEQVKEILAEVRKRHGIAEPQMDLFDDEREQKRNEERQKLQDLKRKKDAKRQGNNEFQNDLFPGMNQTDLADIKSKEEKNVIPERATIAATPGWRNHRLQNRDLIKTKGPEFQRPKIVSAKTGEMQTGVTQINSPEDALHVIAPLRKSAQEQMLAIVLDKDNNVIQVIKHTSGLTDSSMVDPGILAGTIHGIEGAESVYFAHNHPSGVKNQSQNDVDITKTLHRLMEGTGIVDKGMLVIVTGRGGSFLGPNENYSSDIKPTVAPRNKTVPITERRIIRNSKIYAPITSAELGKTEIPVIADGKTGIVLLDNQHNPVSFVNMPLSEMRELRSGKGSGASLLLKEIHETNARAMIANISDGDTLGFSRQQLKGVYIDNVANFAKATGNTRFLDAITEGESLAETGSTFGNKQPFFSKVKTMAITHNLTADNLKHADKLGGIAVPSVAVVDKSMPMDSFGEITLVANKDKLGPQVSKTHRYFNADIYSPRYPSVVYDVDRDYFRSLVESLSDEAKKIAKDSGREIAISEIEDNGVVKGLENYIAMQYEFLKSQDKAPELKYDKNGKIDTFDLRKKLIDKVNQTEYKAWLSDNYSYLVTKEKIFNGFTNAGYRKYLKHDLDTVVRILNKELRGGENFNYGIGSIRAHAAKQFKTIKSIQESRDKFVSKEKMNELKKEIESDYDRIQEELQPYSKYPDSYDNASYALIGLASKGIREFNEYYKDVPNELLGKAREFLDKLKDMPSEYFEGKIGRAVSISEFDGAIVPIGKEYDESVKILKRNGIEDIRRYDPDDPEGKSKALSSFNDLLFSKGTGKGFTKEQAENKLPGRVKSMVDSDNLEVLKSINDFPDGIIDTKESNAEAIYDPASDKIYLFADNLNDINFNGVLAHELYHRALATNKGMSETMKRFDDDFKERFDNASKGIGDEIELSAYRRVVESGAPLEQQQEEFQAYIISEYEKAPETFTGKLLKLVRDFISRIRVILVKAGLDFGTVKSLTPSDLLSISRYGTKKGTAQEGGVKMSFAGKEAITGNDFELANAKRLVAGGLDEEKVRQQTGWFKGADNIWRFEITDEDAKLTEHAKDMLVSGTEMNMPLDEVLDHDKLFAAYPKLRDITVRFEDLGKLEGSFKNGVLLINSKTDSPVSVLMHEIQHVIQTNEGFATGGNVDLQMVQMPKIVELQEYYDALQKESIDAGGRLKELAELDVEKPLTGDVRQELLKLQSGLKSKHDLDRAKMDYFKGLTPMEMQKKLYDMKRSQYDLYKRLYGETEARNVQKRLKLTAAERKEISPETTQDVKNKDAIVTFNGQTMLSLGNSNPNSSDDFLRHWINKNDDVTYNMQDRFIDLLRQMQAIKKSGGEIAETEDPRMAEELYHQRTESRIKEFHDKEFTPILKELHDNKIDMDLFQKVLLARHAPSRNAVMAERNTNLQRIHVNLTQAKKELSLATTPRGIQLAQAEVTKWERAQPFKGTEEERLSLSGMSNDEARDVIANIDPAKRGLILKLADKIDDINNGTLDVMQNYGMETPQEVYRLKKQWSHYIPLHRDEAHPDENNFGHPVGSGFSIKGSGLKKATGSTAEVTNILAHIVAAREQMIRLGEKNKVSIALAQMVENHPDPTFAVSQPLPTIDTLVNGLVETMVDPRYKDAKNVLTYRFNGQDRVIIFNEYEPENMRLALSLKNMDGVELDKVENIIAKGTRWFASVNTQFNIAFGIVNAIRDVQAALLNLNSTPLKGKQKQILGNLLDSFKIITGVERGWQNIDPVLKSKYDRFNKAGGTTAFRQMFENIKDRDYSIRKELEQMDENMAVHSGRIVLKALSDFNTVMENAVRVSTFMTGIDSGLSDAKAASIAKNISVNFNRKGSYTTKVGAYYAFFNASVQGTARIYETLKSPAGKAIIMGGVGLGAALAAMGIMVMGPEEWEKIPEFIRQKSFIIPISGNGYITIPMPLGYSIFPDIGRKLVESVMGSSRVSNTKRFGQLANNMASSLNPLGGSDVVSLVFPTVTDPVINLLRNADWTGRTIYLDDFNSLDPTPGFSRTKSTATEISKFAAEAVNTATGGTKYKPGILSPTPDQIDYVFGQLFGGTGREIMKAEQFIESIGSDEELPSYKIPIAGRFYGETGGDAAERAMYYENVKMLNEEHNQVTGLTKNEGIQKAREYINDHPVASIYPRAHKIQLVINRLKKMPETKERKEKIIELMKRHNDLVKTNSIK